MLNYTREVEKDYIEFNAVSSRTKIIGGNNILTLQRSSLALAELALGFPDLIFEVGLELGI